MNENKYFKNYIFLKIHCEIIVSFEIILSFNKIQRLNKNIYIIY